MLMVVTPTVEETEKLRHTYAKLHTFVYCATYDTLFSCSEKYRPDAILLVVHEVTNLLLRKLERVREVLPSVAVITLSDIDVTSLNPDICYSLRVQKQTLKYQGHYFSPISPNCSPASRNGLIISGLLLLPDYEHVFLFGKLADFTAEEVFLLRFLAEQHPRRICAEELGRHCFTYGKKTPRSTVASRISRINQEARRKISMPIITYRRGEGYGIDF